VIYFLIVFIVSYYLMEQKLVIMRGPSGCGKSTYAKQIYPDAPIFSADIFFVDDSGVYNFNPKKLPEAHNYVHYSVMDAIMSHISVIIVDNTNTEAWEMKKLVEESLILNPEIVIDIVEPTVFNPLAFDVEHLVERNEERSKVCKGKFVPRQALEKMIQRYEHDLTLEKILKSKKPF